MKVYTAKKVKSEYGNHYLTFYLIQEFTQFIQGFTMKNKKVLLYTIIWIWCERWYEGFQTEGGTKT